METRLKAQNCSTCSSMSSSAGSFTECLKAPTKANTKVREYFGFVRNEAGVIVNKIHVLFVNTTSAFVETQHI